MMDLSGSYHMTPSRNFLFDFEDVDGGTILLGDDKACRMKGACKLRIHMKDGTSFFLRM